MKRALVISPFFFPEKISTGKYNTLLVHELIDLGYEVDVICNHPTYPDWRPEITNSQIQGARIIRGGAWIRYPGSSFLRRLILELSFMVHAFSQCWQLKESWDVIITITPPSLFTLAIRLLPINTGARVNIVHDLQAVHASSSKNSISQFFKGLISFVERRSFEISDKNIFLSNEMRDEAIASLALENQNNEVCYPFITIEPYGGEKHLQDLLPPSELHLVYSGALGDKQLPFLLGELMALAAKKFSNLQAHIFSGGANFEALRLKHADSSNMYFHELVEEADLPELLHRSTIQLVPQAPGTSSGSIPSKLPNLLASQTKILAITDPDSELESILSEFESAIALTSWDKDLFLASIGELLEKKIDSERKAQQLAAFSLESLAKEIVSTTSC